MDNLNLYVLIGKTGSGKTALIQQLTYRGYQTIDLESLTNHNGSIFGKRNASNKPISNKEFLRVLRLKKSLFKKESPVFIEWKGKHLGNIQIPESLFEKMQNAPKIQLVREDKYRIREIKGNYCHLRTVELYKNLFQLRNRLSTGCFESALASLDRNDLSGFITAIIPYYDNAKHYQINNNEVIRQVEWNNEPVEMICILIEDFLKNKN